MKEITRDEKTQLVKYIVSDFIASNIAWFIMNLARFHALGKHTFSSLNDYLTDSHLVIGQIFIPIMWIIIFFYSGYYNQTIMKSRIVELKSTILSTLYGALVIFFTVMVNDIPINYISYYKLLAILYVTEFTLVYIPRSIITAKQNSKIHRRQKGFSTLVLGNGYYASETIKELNSMPMSMGYIIKGCIRMKGCQNRINDEMILGDEDDIAQIIEKYKIQKIIIAPDTLSNENISYYLNPIYRYNIPIYLKADNNYILTHSVKMSTIYASPIIEINKDNMPEGQKNVKYTADIVLASLALIVLSPLLTFLAIKVKMDSSGPILYRQERLGKNGKPFTIYKFRTMYTDSEKNGPALASDKDSRITAFGRIMRKYRLDELPQFWNILKGDMSLVGPRPERSFYAEQIIKKAPYYHQIYTVRPGITSWGMVKYGYANNIDQMVERLQYDIIYLDNRNLILDIKILIYTVKTIVTGRGI